MKMRCCNRVWSTADESVFAIDRYGAKPFYNVRKGAKRQDVYVTTCTNCGCMVMSVITYGEDERGAAKILGRDELRGKYAENVFKANFKKFERRRIIPKFGKEKTSRAIPFIYGKSLDGTTQIPRYTDESSDAGAKFTTEVNVYKI
ncbi:MAG: hypothetical protein ACI4CY_05740 [Candidatus Gastranaerophilaceae bacterium]